MPPGRGRVCLSWIGTFQRAPEPVDEDSLGGHPWHLLADAFPAVVAVRRENARIGAADWMPAFVDVWRLPPGGLRGGRAGLSIDATQLSLLTLPVS